jgi:ATP-dependent Clp protease ATP-binding subunit ClpB
VDFSNTIVVMTSNIGSQAIMELSGVSDEKEIHNTAMAALQREFLPEFLNRIDEVIVFHPLGREEIREIVDLQIRRLEGQLQDNGFRLSVSDSARQLLANEGYDPAYGARPLKRVIQQRLQNSLANEILAGRFNEGDTITIDAAADGFIFTSGSE